MAGTTDAIRELVAPSLASSGVEDLELWDVEVSGDTVRVLVDRPGGIDLESLSALAGRVISPLLDEHPELTPDGTYSLEVSSPGLERTLRRPEQYARYLGTEVSVKTRAPVQGARRHQGVLLAADERSVVIDTAEGAPVDIPVDLIDRARTVLVWGPAPKPGQTGQKKKKQPVAKRPAADGPSEAGRSVAFTEREPE
jgi:ribosome maturation factor RimP